MTRRTQSPDSRKNASHLVFLSWSLPQSQAVAAALYEWIPSVIQAAEPWMSEVDIEAGSHWPSVLSGVLATANVGIVCLTPENKDRPWLNFEAGALAKAVGEKTRVCPYLFRMTKAEVTGPLSQMMVAEADAAGTLRVLESVNRAIGEPVAEKVLKSAFEKWYPELKAKLDAIPQMKPAPQRRGDRAIWEETLNIVRELASRTGPTFTFPDYGNALKWVPVQGTTGLQLVPAEGDIAGSQLLARYYERGPSTPQAPTLRKGPKR